MLTCLDVLSVWWANVLMYDPSVIVWSVCAHVQGRSESLSSDCQTVMLGRDSIRTFQNVCNDTNDYVRTYFKRLKRLHSNIFRV